MKSDRTTGLIGASPKIKQCLDLLEVIAPLDVQVLITGETGTGKGLAARLIHQLGPRAKGPMVTVQCGAIPDSLIESALFGHEKGAFTGASRRGRGYFEEANKGTIFLDEIGDSTIPFQTALLHVLQEEEFCRVGSTRPTKVDIRVVAATNKDLRDSVTKGEFRQDLFFRLNVVEVHMPPLREREDDCIIIAEHFLQCFNKKYNKSLKGFTKEVKDLFLSYPWPGNVRELIHVVERAAIIEKEPLVSIYSIPKEMLGDRQGSPPKGKEHKGPEMSCSCDVPFSRAKREFERQYLTEILRRTKGNIAFAAKLSGLRRQNLYIKINKLGIDVDKFRGRH